MKVRIKIDGQISEIELPMECDYGAFLNDEGVITSLVLPINDNYISKDIIGSIILNVTKYKDIKWK